MGLICLHLRDAASVVIELGLEVEALEEPLYVSSPLAMEALEMIRDKDLGIDMVLMELHMPDICGLDLLDEIKRISDLPVLGGWHP